MQSKSAAPDPPTTTTTDNGILIEWKAPPYDYSGFIVLIKDSSGGYQTEFTNCETFSSTDLSCVIPIDDLMAGNFNLSWGSAVVAKIMAVTGQGPSLESAEGAGAFIAAYPDMPTNLVEISRDKSTLGLSWTAPTFAGGVPVSDLTYTISQVIAGENFDVVTGITDTQHVVTDLIPGKKYVLQVQSRNVLGLSTLSNFVVVTLTYRPDAVATVTTRNEGNNVVIEWTAAVANGSPITNYKILINGGELDC